MRVVKKLGEHEHRDIISEVFDSSIKKLYYSLFVDHIEFIMADKHGYELDNRVAKLFLDGNDEFVKSGDKRAIRALVLHQLAHMIVKQRGLDTEHHVLEDVLANRELIKHGFGDDLFYYYYKHLTKKQIADGFNEYLDAHVPWASFHGTNDHDAYFLQKLAGHIQYHDSFHAKGRKILKFMKMNLWDTEIRQRAEKHIKSRLK